jgi:glutathione S-transferase
MKLYVSARSGNSYKPRLLLALLNVPYESVEIDLAKREQKQPHFVALNPRGQVPVLEDGGAVYWDSTALLVYIARKHGGEQWLPADPAEMAQVIQWMALAQNEIHYGLQFARAIIHFSRPGDLEECQAHGRTALRVLDDRLGRDAWLALGRATVADIACFPYVALAPEAGIPLDPYPGVLQWIGRIKALPGFVPLPSLKPSGARARAGVQH